MADAGSMQVWRAVTLVAGPTTAFAYATTAALFLPSFRECPWSTHLPSTLPSLSLFAAAIALALSVEDIQSGIFLVLVIGLLFLSWYSIVQTRVHVVQGGPAPALGPMRGKVVIVTGANTGIGKETTRLLVKQGATVVMACRSESKAQAARSDIVATLPAATDRLRLLRLDLSSLESVRTAAAEARRLYPKVDVLVNNAGVMMSQQHITDDGYDLVMQANHLGHFLLTLLLKDVLAADARILCLTSSTYSYAEKIDLEDPFCLKGRQFSLFGQYSQSKLANVLFAAELARRSKYFVAAVHPGLVRTDVVRNMAWYLRYPNTLFAAFVAALQKTPEQGAWCTVYLASTDTADSPNGQYWVSQKVQALWPCAMDLEGAKQLWVDSERYVHLDGSASY